MSLKLQKGFFRFKNRFYSYNSYKKETKFQINFYKNKALVLINRKFPILFHSEFFFFKYYKNLFYNILRLKSKLKTRFNFCIYNIINFYKKLYIRLVKFYFSRTLKQLKQLKNINKLKKRNIKFKFKFFYNLKKNYFKRYFFYKNLKKNLKKYLINSKKIRKIYYNKKLGIFYNSSLRYWYINRTKYIYNNYIYNARNLLRRDKRFKNNIVIKKTLKEVDRRFTFFIKKTLKSINFVKFSKILRALHFKDRLLILFENYKKSLLLNINYNDRRLSEEVNMFRFNNFFFKSLFTFKLFGRSVIRTVDNEEIFATYSVFTFYSFFLRKLLKEIRYPYFPMLDRFSFSNNFVNVNVFDMSFMENLDFFNFSNYKLNYILKKIFNQYNLCFSYVDRINKDDSYLFTLKFVNNSFFKYYLYKYKSLLLFCSSFKLKLLITLLVDNSVNIKIITNTKRSFNKLENSGFPFYFFKYLQTKLIKITNNIINNNLLSLKIKFIKLNNLRNSIFVFFKKYKINKRLFDSWLSLINDKLLSKKLYYNDNIIENKEYSDVTVDNVIQKSKFKAYYFQYNLVDVNLHYFLISNFHLGFEKNRWDPNFINYYWGIRRNYLILNLTRTWDHFKILAISLNVFVKYRLPILFVNQNRLVDSFLYKTMHSLSLRHSAIFSGFRWLGGALSNVKHIWFSLPSFYKSIYKRFVNIGSTVYLRSLISLIPIGVSLNNNRNKWFLNELLNLKLGNHSMVDGDGIVKFSDNLIVGNSLSLSSSALFLNICCLIIEGSLKKERLFFYKTNIEEIFLSTYNNLIGDFNFESDAIMFGYSKILKKLYKYEQRDFNLTKLIPLKKKKVSMFSLPLSRYNTVDVIRTSDEKSSIWKKYRKYYSLLLKNKNIKFLNKINKYNIRHINYTTSFDAKWTTYIKGKGTFLNQLEKAKIDYSIRLQLLIEHGFSEYIPQNQIEINLLNKCFYIKRLKKKLYNYYFDFVEYILYSYVTLIKDHRKYKQQDNVIY